LGATFGLSLKGPNMENKRLDSAKIAHLVFCFPYKDVGGVPLLFLRLARVLAQLPDFEWRIHLVDYSDGYMAKNLAKQPDPKISLLVYPSEGVCRIPDGSLLIFQSMTPWSIFPRLDVPEDTRVLFWNCYPYNLIPMLPGFREAMLRSHRAAKLLLKTVLSPFAARMKRFVTLLLEKQALVFMDFPNLETTRELLRISISDPVYLPVGIASAHRQGLDSPRARSRDGLRLAWVGRLADFKVHSLARVLQDVSGAAKAERLKLRFDIIGEGDRKWVVEKTAQSSEFFEIRFLGNMSPQSLEDYLVSEVDLLFAMGTSALEAARHGVPAVLLDVSYTEIPKGYGYRFLHEVTGFSLGDVIGQTRALEEGHSIQEILSRIKEDFSSESKRALEYFNRNHDLRVISTNFLECAKNTRLRWADLKKGGFLTKPLAYRALLFLRRNQ
jgi:glycosyltransferase involved in cell wall biosynthesis